MGKAYLFSVFVSLSEKCSSEVIRNCFWHHLVCFLKFNTQTVEEETSKIEDDEYNDLMCKIKEKLKRKPPANKKRKKGKVEAEVMEEEKPETRATRRSTRKTKLTDSEPSAISPKKSFSPVKLPVTAKRRLNELKLRTNREAAQIEEELRRTLSSCDNDFLELSESIPLADLEMPTTLKINYMGTISKVQVKENEKFATIFTKVGELYNLKASEILLCLEDRNIQLDETPRSLDLKYSDVIDCIPYKESDTVVKDDDPNKLLIKVQSNDSRKKIEMHIHKLEKFQDFMEKYSKLRDIPIKDLKFEFDGETIQGTETPEDLEMESGSCIDVQVTKPDQEENSYFSKPQEIIPPIPKDQMLDICVLD